MGKRKREGEATALQLGAPNGKTRKIKTVAAGPVQSYVNIITGSYEKVLHGIIAGVPRGILRGAEAKRTGGKENIKEKHEAESAQEKKSAEDDLEIIWADSFMFNAHSSAIRCLTLSPIPSPTDTAQKVLLATGATDERINLYNLSATPPPDLLSKKKKGPIAAPPTLSGVKVSQNALNKELGSLDHHNGPITKLLFPTRSKLLTAAEDNTISISRTRDWTVLSTIKAPIPKPLGRPSGDTFAPGEVPAGINDFAMHPSMKLMLSVGKGEKCMRLWNLVTGKKAGVLSFERDVLAAAGEGRYGTGEGRRIVWDAEGEEFVVGFERGAVVYDIDCKVRAAIVPRPASKIHQMVYVPGIEGNVLAVSTEDGRILFFDTEVAGVEGEGKSDDDGGKRKKDETIHETRLIAQLGGRAMGVSTRIKDFTILSGTNDNINEDATALSSARNLIFVTGNSDGVIRLWSLSTGELEIAQEAALTPSAEEKKIPQVGHLLAQYETGNRITCLTAFVMNDRAAGGTEVEESEAEFGGFSSGGSGEDDDEDDDDSESD